MTSDEHIDRLEHFVVGMAEERRKDREEYRQLWRDTQRQIVEVNLRLSDRIEQVNLKLSDRIDDLASTVTQLAQESRAADHALRERIDSLVSAMGEFIRREQKGF